MVLPQAMHRGVIQPIGIMAGKLNGAIPAKTPTGSRYRTVSYPADVSISDSPIIRVGTPQAISIGSLTFKMSPRASSHTLPFSRRQCGLVHPDVFPGVLGTGTPPGPAS